MPGVRAFVFSVSNRAAVASTRRSSSSHLAPSSALLLFSGSINTVAEVRLSPVLPSADGLNDVP